MTKTFDDTGLLGCRRASQGQHLQLRSLGRIRISRISTPTPVYPCGRQTSTRIEFRYIVSIFKPLPFPFNSIFFARVKNGGLPLMPSPRWARWAPLPKSHRVQFRPRRNSPETCIDSCFETRPRRPVALEFTGRALGSAETPPNGIGSSAYVRSREGSSAASILHDVLLPSLRRLGMAATGTCDRPYRSEIAIRWHAHR